MLAGIEDNVAQVQRLPGLPSASVRQNPWPGFINVIELDVESSAGSHRSHTDRERVKPRRVDVDAIFKPFTRAGPSDIVSAADISGRLDIHTRAAITGSKIRGFGIMISNSIRPIVEILGLNRAGNSPRNSPERRGRE